MASKLETKTPSCNSALKEPRYQNAYILIESRPTFSIRVFLARVSRDELFTARQYTAAVSVMRDYYAILRIARTATNSEIKAAYRQIALAVHPDVNKVWHGERSICGNHAMQGNVFLLTVQLTYSSRGPISRQRIAYSYSRRATTAVRTVVGLLVVVAYTFYCRMLVSRCDWSTSCVLNVRYCNNLALNIVGHVSGPRACLRATFLDEHATSTRLYFCVLFVQDATPVLYSALLQLQQYSNTRVSSSH